MTAKMTQQEVAESILDILVNDLKVRSGYPMPEQQLRRMYKERNGDGEDIQDGLTYAGDQEWLSFERETHLWFLTEAGHEVA